MPRIIVKSVYDAFDYVMEHYYPFGLEDFAERKDRYAVISIQDTHTQGFGVRFEQNIRCADVLMLYFDDVEKPVDGAMMFNEAMAAQVIDFIGKNRAVETLLVHCYAGQSRSLAVAAFAARMLGGDDTAYFTKGSPNRLVYDTLMAVWQMPRQSKESARKGGLDLRIISRDAAEEMLRTGFPQNAAVISFADRTRIYDGYRPVDYSGVCSRVFTVRVDDICRDELDDFGLTEDEYFPEAFALAEFVRSAAADGSTIICQCEHGQGRSAGCAAAILEWYMGSGTEIFADYRYMPNQMIFNKLLKALNSK